MQAMSAVRETSSGQSPALAAADTSDRYVLAREPATLCLHQKGFSCDGWKFAVHVPSAV